MSSSQDQTSPTTGGTPRLESDRELLRELKVVLWLWGTGLVLVLLGFLIAFVSPPSAATWSAEKVGFLIASLGLHPILTITGALVALRHPWGGGFRRVMSGRFAHPRAAGCADIWAGLLLSGCLDILLFAPVELPFAIVVTFAAGLIALAPLLALLLFDRPR